MQGFKRTAGDTLLVGFEGISLGAGTRAALEELRPAGVVIFSRNLDAPETLLSLWDDLAAVPGTGSLRAVDQEGGRVSRLAAWIGPTPDAACLARSGADSVRTFGAATGRILAALGFGLDFAPVVDLCPPERENGIGARSFGCEPGEVVRDAGAFLEGLQGASVAGCLKHFPGLGDTFVDSHDVLPRIEESREELERTHLVPFARLGARAAAVMVGHGSYPALDPRPSRAATTSHAIATGLLRETLGFGGLVVSDDLEMGAVAGLDGAGEVAVDALDAGCDLLLYCRDLARALRARDALARRAEDDARFARRLEEAAERVRRFSRTWPTPRPCLTRWEEARRSLHAVVRDRPGSPRPD